MTENSGKSSLLRRIRNSFLKKIGEVFYPNSIGYCRKTVAEKEMIMPKRLLITLLVMTACSDPRRDTFIQSQCGEIAAFQEVYDACEKAAKEMYEAMNK